MSLYDPRIPQQYASDALLRAKQSGYRHGAVFHSHHDEEFYFDLRADEQDGPRTYHGIGWVCACGRVEYGNGCLEADKTARHQHAMNIAR